MKQLLSLLLGVAFLFSASVSMAEVERFDLNKGTVEQLTAIPNANISPEIAQAIIDQSKKAPYKFAEDLLKAKGVDNKMVEAINPLEEDNTLFYDPDNEEMTLAPSKC